MLTLPRSVRIVLATEPVDMRRGHDGLCAIVRNHWRLDPFAGHLFVFLGKRADRVKRLFWDRGGFGSYFYARDHLDSVRDVLASDGTTVTSRISYEPWGQSTEIGAGALTDFGFTGHYLDRPSGLNLALYRQYSPSMGRWLSPDPLGIAGGTNLYGYVLNDPVELSDTLGLEPGCGCSDDCFSRCMKAQGADWALGALGASGPFVSIPKVGRDLTIARRTGASLATSFASWCARGLRAAGANGAGTALRQLGRRLNPYANAVAAGAGSYLATSALICTIECAQKDRQ